MMNRSTRTTDDLFNYLVSTDTLDAFLGYKKQNVENNDNQNDNESINKYDKPNEKNDSEESDNKNSKISMTERVYK